jgi:hypothetical protein
MCLSLKGERKCHRLAGRLPAKCLSKGLVAGNYAWRQWKFQHQEVSMDTLITFRFGICNDSGAQDFLARTNEGAVIRMAREQLARPAAERNLLITGLIQRAPTGANLA